MEEAIFKILSKLKERYPKGKRHAPLMIDEFIYLLEQIEEEEDEEDSRADDMSGAPDF